MHFLIFVENIMSVKQTKIEFDVFKVSEDINTTNLQLFSSPNAAVLVPEPPELKFSKKVGSAAWAQPLSALNVWEVFIQLPPAPPKP